MCDEHVRTLLHAAGGDVDDVAAAIVAMGPEVAADVALDELRPRLRLADAAEFDSDISVLLRLRFDTTVVERFLVVERGATGWWLGSRGPSPSATITQGLAELVRGSYAPATARGAVRSVEWHHADDFSAFHSPGPVFAVVQRLLDALDHRERPGLNSLAVRHGSDKWGPHNYTPHYEDHFAPVRDRKLTVLEIGVGGFHDPFAGGASLRMWRDYFPRAMVYGLDVVDKSKLDGGRIRTIRCDQSDVDDLRRAMGEVGRPDIVIDDGSHISRHVCTTFRTLFPYLRPGGKYVIEDVQTGYWPSFGGNDLSTTDLGTSVGMLKDLIDGLNHQELTSRTSRAPQETDLCVSGMHLHHNLAIIDKGSNSEPGAPAWLSRTLPEG